MINLCLVVIATQFSETKRRETERMLAERAQRAHHKRGSQSNSSITTSSGGGGGLDVGGCYVELVHYVEYLVGTARRRLARFVRRRRRRRRAAAQLAAAAADRPPPTLASADSSPRRRRRRRRRCRRDLDRRPSDAPAADDDDDEPRCRAEPPDSTAVACRAAVHDTTTDVDGQSAPASAALSPRRVKPVSVANSEYLQTGNTGLS